MRPVAIALFAAVLVAAPLAAREAKPPVLSVQIASPARFGKRTLDLKAVPVVVANGSAADLRVWREWCSWGWFQLSFEIRGGHCTVVLDFDPDRHMLARLGFAILVARLSI